MRQLHTSRLDRIAELTSPPGFHLDERNRAVTLYYEVDIPVSVPKSPLNDSPPLAPEPPLRDSLSQLTKRLPGR